LHNTPADIDALAPLVTREILYRLLTGAGNRIVRHIARCDSQQTRSPAPSPG
jgi:hypothetical protein